MSPAQETNLARRRAAHRARVNAFLAMVRLCPACGSPLVIAEGERFWKFRARKTCSEKCRRHMQGVGVSETRRFLSSERPLEPPAPWPSGASFAKHDSAEADADHGSRWMPHAADFHSFAGSSSAVCAEHRWAGL